jgi:superfamily II DNA/RNA helicase
MCCLLPSARKPPGRRRQTFVFSATLTFVPTKPQRLEFTKKKKKKAFHQITTKEKLGQRLNEFAAVLNVMSV